MEIMSKLYFYQRKHWILYITTILVCKNQDFHCWVSPVCFKGQCSPILWLWHHHMETIAMLLALSVGNSPATSEFSSQRPVMRSFDVFFHLHLKWCLSKQWWGWWFETPSPHYDLNVMIAYFPEHTLPRAHIQEWAWVMFCYFKISSTSYFCFCFVELYSIKTVTKLDPVNQWLQNKGSTQPLKYHLFAWQTILPMYSLHPGTATWNGDQ